MGTTEVRNSLTNWLPFRGPLTFDLSLCEFGYDLGVSSGFGFSGHELRARGFDVQAYEMDFEVRSQDEWRAFRKNNPDYFSADRAKAWADHVARCGLFDPQIGQVSPSEVKVESSNYRESVIADNLNGRARGILLLLQSVWCGASTGNTVYASEALSPLGRRLKRTLSNFTGSEYLPTLREKLVFARIKHQDVLNLSFKDDAYDIYISCDVLEHVPDLPRAISEAHRILKPGGHFIGTVPFAPNSSETIVKARLVDGKIEHLTEPEYHGNPTRPEDGSLVFSIPGWDLLETMLDVGFSRASIRLIGSRRHGVFGEHEVFQPFFCAIK